jgi:hypothetical protein
MKCMGGTKLDSLRLMVSWAIVGAENPKTTPVKNTEITVHKRTFFIYLFLLSFFGFKVAAIFSTLLPITEISSP